MENELKNLSRNFRSEKFFWSEFLAEWKTVLMCFKKSDKALLSLETSWSKNSLILKELTPHF